MRDYASGQRPEEQLMRRRLRSITAFTFLALSLLCLALRLDARSTVRVLILKWEVDPPLVEKYARPAHFNSYLRSLSFENDERGIGIHFISEVETLTNPTPRVRAYAKARTMARFGFAGPMAGWILITR